MNCQNVWRRSVPPALLCMFVFWVLWIAWRHPSARNLVYNVPISLSFSLLLWEMIFSRAPKPYWIVWTLGAAELVARILYWFPASGHIVWCILMTVHARHRHAPRWVRVYVALVFAQSVVFKVAFGGISGGLAGAGFGAALAWLLAVLLRRDAASQPVR